VDIWKEFDQNIITHSAAHHLMAVDDLVSKLGYARVSDVARQLNITRGSVSISLKPMKEAGLLLQDENRHLRLSEKGQRLVDAVKNKRLLIQRLLSEVLGVDSQQAEIDACKMEHLTSNETARQLLAFFRFIDSQPQPASDFLAIWHEFNGTAGQTAKAYPAHAGQPQATRKGVSDP
jgi:Mn-dependent DtxR family transcriptional regulator